MKRTQLDLLAYLKKLQYLEDEGFTIEPDDRAKELTLGVYIKELDERFCYGVNQVKDMALRRQKIDITAYHGATKIVVEGINKIIENYVPPTLPPGAKAAYTGK